MRYLDSLMSTGETVQIVVRQHWMVMARALLANGLAAAVLVLAAGVGHGYGTAAGSVVTAAALMLACVPLALILREAAQWWARQFVVTTRRVMHVEGVLNKSVSDSNLDKVNDIVLRQSLVGRMLGYGDVEIITGSDMGVDRLQRIRRPLQFQRVLLDNKEDFDTLVRLADGASMGKGDIPAAIEQLAALRDRGLVSHEEFERKKADLLARM